jgi:hypothetical protein
MVRVCPQWWLKQWAEFEGNGVYGYGRTVVGAVVLYAEDKFSGRCSTAKPFQIETSRAMMSVKASGVRIYFIAAHPRQAGKRRRHLQGLERRTHSAAHLQRRKGEPWRGDRTW